MYIYFNENGYYNQNGISISILKKWHLSAAETRPVLLPVINLWLTRICWQFIKGPANLLKVRMLSGF